jgi:hypothetical protein
MEYISGFEQACKEGRIRFKNSTAVVGGEWGMVFEQPKTDCCGSLKRLFITKKRVKPA